MLKLLEWKGGDFVLEKILKTEWKAYLKKYPYMSYGTRTYKTDDESVLVKRFVSREVCIKYCTAPTLFDIGADIY